MSTPALWPISSRETVLTFMLYQDFKIQNIVGSCDVKFPIRLEGLAYSHGAFSSVSRMVLCFFKNLCLCMLLLFSSVSWMMFTLTFFILQYEPELFPGLIYRMKQPKIVLLIFVSGKIVLTGAKVAVFFYCIYFHWLLFSYIWKTIKLSYFQVREETYTAFENIYPVLTEFRKVQQWYAWLVGYASFVFVAEDVGCILTF